MCALFARRVTRPWLRPSSTGRAVATRGYARQRASLTALAPRRCAARGDAGRQTIGSQLQDLVTLACLVSSSSFEELRVVGLELLQAIIQVWPAACADEGWPTLTADVVTTQCFEKATDPEEPTELLLVRELTRQP